MHKCDNCGRVSELVEDFGRPFDHQKNDEFRYLCRVCSATYLSCATSGERTKLSQGEIWLMQSTAVLFNYLFDKLNIDQSELGDDPNAEENYGPEENST